MGQALQWIVIAHTKYSTADLLVIHFISQVALRKTKGYRIDSE